MFGGHAPPFGWYCSASRSRASAPRSTRDLRHLAGRVRVVGRELAAPLGLGVAAAAGGEHDGAGVDGRARRRARASRPSSSVSSRSGAFVKLVPLPASQASRSCFVIAWPVRSPTWSRRLRGRAAAAGEPVAAVLARELDAELLEPVDRRLAPRRSAPRRAAGRRSRARSARRPRRAARASRRRRTRPGCRPAPSRSCSPAASPSSRARPARPRARPRRRRRGPRRRCRSRARRRRPRRDIHSERLYLISRD